MGYRAARLALLLVVFAVSACTTLNIKRGVSEEELARTRRVGVLAALGDNFYGISVGTTVFNNTSFDGTVPDWGIDPYAADRALGLLQKNPRFQTSLLDRGSLTLEDLKANEGKALWDAAERQGFDRVVLIRPGVSSNFPFFRPGFGFFERSFLGSGGRCVYAAYVVDVYDVATRKPIAWEWGGPSPCQMGADSNLPFRPKFEDYSAEEKATLKRRLQERMAETLPYALTQLSLLASPQ